MHKDTVAYGKMISGLESIKIMLDDVPDHTCSTELHHLQVQSFIFLSHAAMEQYIEEIALWCADEAMSKLHDGSIITRL
ncbi:hypothetical protein [Parvularcula oceani]|uniref:hypothetical protein n=1 Tax=Parvularcula oceani TaxID=1247963 RepID=UPI0012DD68C4|nr:hypothetical protein [Parvularcula oceani]